MKLKPRFNFVVIVSHWRLSPCKTQKNRAKRTEVKNRNINALDTMKNAWCHNLTADFLIRINLILDMKVGCFFSLSSPNSTMLQTKSKAFTQTFKKNIPSFSLLCIASDRSKTPVCLFIHCSNFVSFSPNKLAAIQASLQCIDHYIVRM